MRDDEGLICGSLHELLHVFGGRRVRSDPEWEGGILSCVQTSSPLLPETCHESHETSARVHGVTDHGMLPATFSTDATTEDMTGRDSDVEGWCIPDLVPEFLFDVQCTLDRPEWILRLRTQTPTRDQDCPLVIGQELPHAPFVPLHLVQDQTHSPLEAVHLTSNRLLHFFCDREDPESGV